MATKTNKTKGGKIFYNPIRVKQFTKNIDKDKPNKNDNINDMVKDMLIKIYNAIKNIIINSKIKRLIIKPQSR